jgi:hypothetical protein
MIKDQIPSFVGTSEVEQNQYLVNSFTKAIIKNSLVDIVAAIKKINHDDPERLQDVQVPFTVAEFGYATAECSIDPIQTIIEEIRKISTEIPILVFVYYMPKN